MNQELSDHLFSEYVEGWISGDVERVAKTLDRDCLVVESHGPRFDGLETVRKWIRDWVTFGSKVYEWRIIERIYEKEKGAYTWFFRCLADGKEHEINGIGFVEFRDEKILKITEFMRTQVETNKTKKPNQSVQTTSASRRV